MFVCMFYEEGVKAENNLGRLHTLGVGEDKSPAFPSLRNIPHLQKREYKCLKTTGKEFSQFLGYKILHHSLLSHLIYTAEGGPATLEH